MAIENPSEGLELYPLHKLIALIDNENDFKEAISELTESGFEDNQISYFHGKKGLDVLDLYEDHHGLMDKLLRKFQIFSSREAEEGIKTAHESMKKGSYFITVDAEIEENKEKALEILKKFDAYNIFYFRRAVVEVY